MADSVSPIGLSVDGVVDVWGKSRGLERPYPLVAHLVDTAAVAYTFLSRHLPSGTLRALGISRNEDEKLRDLAFLAGMHDLGKAIPCFQSGNKDWAGSLRDKGFVFPSGEIVKHAHATQLSLPEAFGGLTGELLGDELSGVLGAGCMLGGHHGVFNPVSAYEIHVSRRGSLAYSFPQLGDERWEILRRNIADLVGSAVGSLGQNFLSGVPLVVGAGLVVLSDWIASQESFIEDVSGWPEWGGVSWDDYFDRKLVLAGEHIRDAGLEASHRGKKSFGGVFGFEPRPLQESIERHFESLSPGCGGVLVAAAPMGVGKTEAALRAAAHMGGQDSGLLFLLPTMATADSMFERVVSYVGATATGVTDVGLVHSMAGFNDAFMSTPVRDFVHVSDDDATKAVASQWLRGRQRTLLAPVAAATIDQLLAATLRSKRSFLRWLGVSGKVVVIDEAHSFDAYMNGLLEVALEWLGAFGVPVIIMSATIPSRISKSLVDAWCRGAAIDPPQDVCPYPGWLHLYKEGAVAQEVDSPVVDLAVQNILVEGWKDNWVGVARGRLERIATGGGCALVVCNTVREAQHLTAELEDWASVNGVDLRRLHSRFQIKERQRLTSEIVDAFGKNGENRPKKAVLVATQVVEQSLDVDFDLVISALAPIAPLLQRSGRGHRHDRPRPKDLSTANLEILIPVKSGVLAIPTAWQYVYPSAYMQRTWEHALDKGAKTKIVLPTEVQEIVDVVYGSLEDVESYEDEKLMEQHDKEWLQKLLNSHSRIPTPRALRSLSEISADVDEELVLSTRLGLDSVPVVCVWKNNGQLFLDREMKHLMPTGTLTKKDVKDLLGCAVYLRRTNSLQKDLGETISPEEWRETPWLTDAYLLIFDSLESAASTTNFTFVLSAILGLIQEKVG